MVNDEVIIKDRSPELETSGDVLAKCLRKVGCSTNCNDKVEAEVEGAREHIPATCSRRCRYTVMCHASP